MLAVRGDDDAGVGLLFVADDRVRDAFTPEEIALLETVAAQIGVVVANSRVYSRMKERDRLAALGSMAAGLAHEVKNPLGAIKGAAQLLEEVGARSGTSDPAAREFVGIILEEVNRLDRVVGSFLDYARPHAGNPIPLDLNAAVRRTVQIVSQPDHRRRHRRAARSRRAAAAREDRPGEVPPGADEPDAERHPGHGRPRQDHRDDADAPRGAWPRPAAGWRHPVRRAGRSPTRPSRSR